jgi:protein phosphatase PTC1
MCRDKVSWLGVELIFRFINSGWFAIFDGHAGKAAAEFCGNNVHQVILSQSWRVRVDGWKIFEGIITENPEKPVPELLDKTFIATDTQLGDKKGVHSGCTAVVAFVRVEKDLETSRKRRILYTANVGDARAVLW